MATLLTVHGEIKQVHPTQGESFTLEEMQAFVDGYIEHIGVYEDRHVIGNEDGLLIGLVSRI